MKHLGSDTPPTWSPYVDPGDHFLKTKAPFGRYSIYKNYSSQYTHINLLDYSRNTESSIIKKQSVNYTWIKYEHYN